VKIGLQVRESITRGEGISPPRRPSWDDTFNWI